ncbi:MAG TPA: hypothetical protein VFN11_03220 [Ktedonobacterales bacterium]|nr:hypothetical protein [Ktedonobacterales bacterium]
MATGGLNVFRENAVYVGMGKQSAWGTGVAPTWFNLWLDGSDANPERSVKSERGGDSSPFELLSWTASQHQMIKIVEYAFPQLAGYALQALLCTGSDSLGAATANTTLSSSITKGASSLSVAASIGTVGTLAVAVSAAYGNAAYEVVTVDLTTKAGVGPFTYTLASSGTFKNAHTNGDTVVSAATHTLTRKASSYDPYSIEIAWNTDGVGSLQRVYRYVDAVCTDVKISHATGNLLQIEHTWYAANVIKQAALTSTVYEQSKPFRFDQASGAWKILSATTGNAATFKRFDVSLKNSTSPDDCQTEGITPNYFIPGNIDVTGSFDVLFNSWQEYEACYFGANTGAGATDSATIGYESLASTWTADGVNSLALSLPNIYYTAAKLSPKRSAKALTQPVAYKAIQSGPAGAVTPFTATLTNAYSTAY